ncbi:MAG: NF038104 family lipoprotein [Mariprofundaceae bacterium]|nr:NF038104 family lipoprotein [Mariprofundaceae bacterium]
MKHGMTHTGRTWLLALCCAGLCSACIGTVVGTAVDITTAVVKVPFKVAGAVVDVATSDDDQDE